MNRIAFTLMGLLIGIIWLVSIAISLTLLGAIIWVAWHFISKYW